MGSLSSRQEPLASGDAYSGTTFRMGALVEGHGGDPLCSVVLTESMFGVDAMEAGRDVAFERNEGGAAQGGARGARLNADGAEDGAAAGVQRRLHAMLMQSAIERQAREMED